MKNDNRKYYLLNYVFLTGLIFLFLNDHIFKLVYTNWFTGKLSDFLGVLVLPMFISFFLPKSIKINVIAVGIFFVFWKSGYSQPIIDLYNQIAPIKITRLVDYTDLIALSILPVSYLIITRISDLEKIQIRSKGLFPIMFLIPTIFVFMATSPPYYYRYTFSDGELRCFKCTTTVDYSKTELLELLAKNKYNIFLDSMSVENAFRFEMYWKDSTNNFLENYPYYKIDTLTIGQDTITEFQFALEKISEDKTKVWINGMNIPKEIPNNKVERTLRRYYKRLIKSYIGSINVN